MRLRLAISLSLLWILCAGSAHAARTIVAVSIPPQAYFAERIGGDLIETQVLLPPGASPVTYEPSPRQIVAISKAALYLKVGHPDFVLETRHLKGLLTPKTRVLDMSVGVDFLKLEAHDDGHGHGESDPHLWLSPKIVREFAPRIAEALKKLLPAQTAKIEQNLQVFLQEIAALDQEIIQSLDRFRGREFVVYHPAWGYFARDYGLVQRAVETGGKDPGPAHLVHMTDELRTAGCKVIFVQSGFSDKGPQVIAREIGARVEVLDPLAREWGANLRRVTGLLVEALER